MSITTGQTWIHRLSFYRMYLVLNAQGKRAEALAWLKLILSEPGGAGNDPNIAEALRREGL